MTFYVFDQTWQRELDRLHGLENTFDASTTQRLTQLGVRDGWRCLRLPRRQRSYEGVARHLEEGLRYADDHELSYWRQLLASARVRYWFDQGRWREAEDEAARIMEDVRPNRLAFMQVLIAVGALRGRQGREDVDGCLERAQALARDHPELDTVCPVAPAVVERAVLRGEAGRARDIAAASLAQASGAWEGAGLWFWARQAGADPAVPPSLPRAVCAAPGRRLAGVGRVVAGARVPV